MDVATKNYRMYTRNPTPTQNKPKSVKVCKTSGYAYPIVAIWFNEVRVTAVMYMCMTPYLEVDCSPQNYIIENTIIKRMTM